MLRFKKNNNKNLHAQLICIILQVLRDILKEVQSSMVPRTIVREWACATFQSATDYWTFRKVKQPLYATTLKKNVDDFLRSKASV